MKTGVNERISNGSFTVKPSATVQSTQDSGDLGHDFRTCAIFSSGGHPNRSIFVGHSVSVALYSTKPSTRLHRALVLKRLGNKQFVQI
jgi:hypothetical protein